MNRSTGQAMLAGLLLFVGVAFLEVALMGISFSSAMPILRLVAWLAAFAFWIYLPSFLIHNSRVEGSPQTLGAYVGWSALLGCVTALVWAFAAYAVLGAGATYAGIPWLALTLFGGLFDGVRIILLRATDLGVLIIVMLLGGLVAAFAGLIWDAVERSRPAY